ncbi:SPOR domain-containing protein [Extensimonas sp. H3M7-6]|uniref:SPOR domain-containing protein n=1 Tax=Extensimonas soli TaxID=3031322 RepID=UPI0023D98A00|nr:SPOR domain-containing protein [Extensimonas sp. H3M7-6]MDF1480746.1 SPOR domain-containing protein [Extensimonas sp. H3M7-6]
MALFKIRWPGQDAQDDKPAQRSRAGAAESVEAMRRRARHRLIGAAVLVLLGVIGFPLLFDTQPRPVAADIPIEIPDRNKAAPLVVPAPASPQTPLTGASQPPAFAKDSAPDKAAGASSVSAAAGLGRGEELVDAPAARPAEKSSAPLPPSVKPQAAGRTEGPTAPSKKEQAKPASVHEAKPETKPAAAAAPQRKSAPDEAARVRALLEGGGGSSAAKTAAAAGPSDAARFIVQVGAFADADKAREVRAKLERAGLKTYTQVLDTKDGKRTRVRVGPFASKAEADKAAARIHGLGLSASVLGL